MAEQRLPLRDRIPSPQSFVPEHPDVAVWRPATPADIRPLVDLKRAQDAVDHPNYVSTHDEITQQLDHSFVDMASDTIAGFTATGEVIAEGLVVMPPGQDTLVRSVLAGGVHPDYRGRGIGRRLLTWQETRAREQLAGSEKSLPGWIMAYADERAQASVRLLRHSGFGIARYFLELERVLADPIPDVEPADGIRIEQYRPEVSGLTQDARNDSFRDHWGSQPMSDEQWHSFVSGATFRNDLSFVATATNGGDRDSVVGFALSEVNEEDWQRQGFTSAYVDFVGVARGWRRNRIAPALLAHVLRAARDAGYERVALDVDAESPTGALGLYTRMGFTQTNEEICFTKEF